MALQNLTASGHLCEAILQSLSSPATEATLNKLQGLLCSINQSSLLEAAMTGFLANHQFAKQVHEIRLIYTILTAKFHFDFC